MRKKLLLLTLSSSLFIMCAYPVQAKSFAGREEEMNQKCSAIYDEETQRECEEYKAYIQEQNQNLNKDIQNIKSQLSAVGNDINKLTEQLKKNNDNIKNLDSKILNVQNSIDAISRNIVSLNKKIDEKAKNIEKRDKQMRERLVEMQVYTGSNNFVDFLMGSSSFADLLRRSEILGELNAYESEQIKALNKEKEELYQDKEKVQKQKDMLETQKASLKNNKEKAVELKAVNDQLMSKYRKQEDELLDAKIRKQLAQSNLPTIDTSIIPKEEPDNGNDNNSNGGDSSSGGDSSNGGNSSGGGDSSNGGGSSGGGGFKPSSGLIVPIQGKWYRSAGTWAYPDGGVHRGMDFGTYNATGLSVVAPANGIVIWTYNGCANNGYLGNQCGIPNTTGNNMTIVVRANNTTYAISFYHLTSTVAPVGSMISQGQLIAYTGNSGSSTGPHCHIEVINLGNISLETAVQRYNTGYYSYPKDLSFGVGWGIDPKACGSAPCRMRPETFWGY